MEIRFKVSDDQEKAIDAFSKQCRLEKAQAQLLSGTFSPDKEEDEYQRQRIEKSIEDGNPQPYLGCGAGEALSYRFSKGSLTVYCQYLPKSIQLGPISDEGGSYDFIIDRTELDSLNEWLTTQDCPELEYTFHTTGVGNSTIVKNLTNDESINITDINLW